MRHDFRTLMAHRYTFTLSKHNDERVKAVLLEGKRATIDL